MPNFLGDYKSFSAEFARPMTKGQLRGASACAISASIEKLNCLHQQCLPFILRREKEQVLRELPPKIVSVVPVRMSALQEKLYQSLVALPIAKAAAARLERMLEGTCESREEHSASGDVLKSLLLLRLVCTHPALLRHTEGASGADNSPVGFGLEASGKLLALVDILRESGIYEDTTSGADNDRSLLFCDVEEKSNDFDSLVESTADFCSDTTRLNTHGEAQAKCIIFAQFTRSLDIVEDLVLKRLMPSLQYVRLDGKVPASERARIASSFNCNPCIKIILATTRVGGLGLNLTGVFHITEDKGRYPCSLNS